MHLKQIADVLVVLDQYNLVGVDVELFAGVKQLEAAGPRQEVFEFQLPNQFPVGGAAGVGRSVGCCGGVGSCDIGNRSDGVGSGCLVDGVDRR